MVKLAAWPRVPLVSEPRRPYIENVRGRATNRTLEGVEIYDWSREEREEEGNP